MRGTRSLKEVMPPARHEKWGWFFALGIVLLIMSAVSAAYVVQTSVIVVWFIGLAILAAGVVQIVHAFIVMNWGQFFLWLIAGIVYAAAGILCIDNPFVVLPLLTYLLAFFFLCAGVLRMVIGFRMHYVNGAAWVIINGIVTTLLGLLIIFQGPMSTFWVFGLLISIDLLFQGIGWIVFSLGLKRLSR